MPLFPPTTKSTWLDKVTKDLRGRPLSELDFTVVGETFSPFHHPEDQPVPPPPVRGPRAEPCRSGVSLPITDPKADNKLILDLLNKGANALFLHSDTVDLQQELDTILDGVYREIIHVYLMQGEAEGSLRSLQGHLCEVDTLIPPPLDPIERMAVMLNQAATELSMKTGHRIEFWADADDNYLSTIANLRAMRLCYQLVADAYDTTTPCYIIVDPTTELDDKYGGMISTSAIVSAAIIGGADTVFIPSGHTEDAQEKNFLRRVALNSYNVLDHEAYLNRVADPAAGSYYIENLTETIARRVWSRFQEISAQ